jgi:hypothetical protein
MLGSRLADLPSWLALNLAVVAGVLGVVLAPLALDGLSRENVYAALSAALPVTALLAGELPGHKWVPVRWIRSSPGACGS